ncbi:MAG: UDP-3-O-(3-hydroxymyristoyl)glucosamine N-acyltransferase [bacterium]
MINNKNSKNVSYSLLELSSRFGGTIIGDANVKIKNIAPISEATEGDITYLTNPKYSHLIHQTKASALIASGPVSDFIGPIWCTKNPYLLFAKVLGFFFSKEEPVTGIAQDAIIGKNVRFGKNISIKSGAIIGDNVDIGNEVIIHPGVIIGAHSTISDNSILYPNVVIYPGIIIGKRVIIHAGVVIGSDGFGFAQDSEHLYKVPQVGKCIIEDDVEIGANTTIDRATIGDTVIGSGTKIDNLVQIGHNAVIGKNCIIVAQSAIAGSSKLGNGVIIGGQSAISGHVNVGDGVILAAKSGITKDTPSGTVLGGIIGRPIKEWRRSEVATRNLPKLQNEIRLLSKRLKKLEDMFPPDE